MATRRAINHSRAFWELKAEQVMDRVFNKAGQAYHHPPAIPTPSEAAASEPMIEVEVREEPSPVAGSSRPGGPWRGASFWTARPARAASNPGSGHWPGSRRLAAWNLATPPQHKLLALGSLAVLTGSASLVCWHGWNQASLDLRQERTLWLLERLKGLGTADASGTQASSASPPGASGAQTSTDPAAPKNNGAAAAASMASTVPPPPPDEPWIQQLAQLPGALLPGQSQPEVLRVPVSGPLNRPAPPANRSAATSARPPGRQAQAAPGSSPELVGVVQVAGRPGSAIFQVGTSSTNALVGELIGSSGWRLVATAADSAVIERGGVQRRIAISSGF